jgi:hypothetical protein
MSEMTAAMQPPVNRRTTEHVPESPAFAEVVQLMALGSEADARLKAMGAEIDQAYLDLVDEHRAEYAKLQAALAQAEAAMELYCQQNPGWFKLQKSIKTPYGKVAFRAGTSLVVKDKEATVRLIEALFGRAAERMLHQEKSPNLEVLESWADEDLKRIMVERVRADVFRFTPAAVDMGKATKEQAEKN